MTPVVLYLSQSAICLGALTGIYYLLLRKETYFQWNRMYLLGSALIATILPLINIPVSNPTATSNLPTQWLSTVTVTTENAENTVGSSLPEASILFSALFSAISMLLLIRVVRQSIKLATIRKKGQIRYRDGVPIIYSTKVQAPFSFFGSIYLPIADQEPDNNILLHEMAHITQHHSFDILFMKLLQIVQWANPFYYMVIKELRIVHEFQADNHVLQKGIDIRTYQNVLLQNSFATPKSFLANSFYFFNIKTRCTMMTQNKRKFPAVLKTALSIPLILPLLVVGIACERTPNDGNQVDKASSQSDQAQQADNAAATDSVYKKVPTMPEFPGGKRELQNYLGEVAYPQKAKDNNIEGNVYVKFIIDQSGNIEKADIARGTGTILDSSAIAHVRNMPQWEPGRNADGQKVKVQYVVPFRFKMDNKDKK